MEREIRADMWLIMTKMTECIMSLLVDVIFGCYHGR